MSANTNINTTSGGQSRGGRGFRGGRGSGSVSVGLSDAEDGEASRLQVEALQEEVGRLTKQIESMAKDKEASDVEREAHRMEAVRLTAESQVMARAKEAWDTKHKATKLVLDEAFADLRLARGEIERLEAEKKDLGQQVEKLQPLMLTNKGLVEEVDGLKNQVEELKPLVLTNKGLVEELRGLKDQRDLSRKRQRELEHELDGSRKRQRCDECDEEEEDPTVVHPLVDGADSVWWVVRYLPLSMLPDHCPSDALTVEVINLFMTLGIDEDMRHRLDGFVDTGTPDIDVPYCLRAVLQMGLGPDPLSCICGDGEPCVVITKNEDGTVFFGHGH